MESPDFLNSFFICIPSSGFLIVVTAGENKVITDIFLNVFSIYRISIDPNDKHWQSRDKDLVTCLNFRRARHPFHRERTEIGAIN